MRIVATPEALKHVAGRGGVVYLRAKETRCCGGRTAVLEVATEPGATRVYEQIHREGSLEIWATKGLRAPEDLHLDLSRKRALRAFWNGQAWIG